MKLYLVQKVAQDYNDEDYFPSNFDEGGLAFRSKDNAITKCKELDKAERKTFTEDRDERSNRNFDSFYKVVEIEVQDEDVVTYASAAQKVKEAREEMRRQAKSVFSEGSKKLFEAHPGLESFSVRAYTPYFNDGDTCEYSVHTDTPDINGEDLWDSEDCNDGYEWVDGKRKKTSEPGKLHQASKDVVSFLQSFDEDDILAMFGDHVKITVTRGENGGDTTTEVTEYSHD